MHGRVLAALFVLESAAWGDSPDVVTPTERPSTSDTVAIATVTRAVEALTAAKNKTELALKTVKNLAKTANDEATTKLAAAVEAQKAANEAPTDHRLAEEASTKAAEADKARDDAAAANRDVAKAQGDADTVAFQLKATTAEKASIVNSVQGACSGWGLLTPLYGVSNRSPGRTDPNKRDELRITGPVASGLGAGYYWPLLDGGCDHVRMWTAEAFAFSEGLDPSKTFQLGVGAGIGLTVFGKFQFGIAVGYDLVRFENINTGGVARTYSNGLLLGNDVFGCGYGGRGKHWGDAAKCAARNATLLFTFTLNTGATDAATPAPKPGTVGTGSGG